MSSLDEATKQLNRLQFDVYGKLVELVTLEKIIYAGLLFLWTLVSTALTSVFCRFVIEESRSEIYVLNFLMNAGSLYAILEMNQRGSIQVNTRQISILRNIRDEINTLQVMLSLMSNERDEVHAIILNYAKQLEEKVYEN